MRGRWRWATTPWAGASRLGWPLAGALLLAACSRLPLRSPEPEPNPEAVFLREGLDALEVEDFAGAEDRFRRLAYRCESGEEGRRALILLASMELDARNGDGRPDEAARLAAAFLNLPEAPGEERAIARTLYLTALDRGGAPVEDSAQLEDPAAASAREELGRPFPARLLPPARRFSECALGPPEWSELPGPPEATLAEALREAERRGTARQQLVDSLAARIEALEAELARIQKLLRGGGGGVGRDVPGP